MQKIKHGVLIRLIFSFLLIFALINFLFMRLDISKTDLNIKEIQNQIKDQKLKNNELTSILTDENIDDFYRIVAENDLGYGSYDEKVYVDITGR